MKIKIKIREDGICLFDGGQSYSLYVENIKDYELNWFYPAYITYPKTRIIKFVEIDNFLCNMYERKNKINNIAVPTYFMKYLGMECDYEICGILFYRDKNRSNSRYAVDKISRWIRRINLHINNTKRKVKMNAIKKLPIILHLL